MKEKYILTACITFITDLVASSAPADYAHLLNETPTTDDYTRQFMRDNNNQPVLQSYGWIGYVKKQCRGCTSIYRDISDEVFIEERRIPIESGKAPDVVTFESEDLSHDTMRAEVIPAGCKCRITFVCYTDIALNAVKAALNCGRTRGYGPRRDEEYGKFDWECLSLKRVLEDGTSVDVMNNQYGEKLRELKQLAYDAKAAAIAVVKSCDEAIASSDESLARQIIGNEAFSGDIWDAVETMRTNALETAQTWDNRLKQYS
jgi:hypothetical protein